MNVHSRCFIALLAAVSVGCTEGPWAASVSLEVADHLSAPELRPPALESGGQLIRVRRSLNVPADCKSLRGAVAHAAGQVTVRIGPAPGQGMCGDREVEIPYTATITGLRPGRYVLRVVHTTSGSPAAVVLEHPVIVLGTR